MKTAMRRKAVRSLLPVWCGLILTRCGAESDLSVKQRSFADQLVPQLHVTDGKNDCTSSLGVSMMFDLIGPGATSDTKDQMCAFLGFPCDSPGLAWNETADRITKAFDGQCLDSTEVAEASSCTAKVPTLKIVNSIWTDSGTELLPEYAAVVGGFIRMTDFSSAGAGAVINEWVNTSTNGKIDTIVDDGPIDYALLAINSIYLNASWKYPFEEIFTNEDYFYKSPSRDVSSATMARFMHKVSSAPYSETALPGYQIISLPFVFSDLSMVIVLPLDEATDGVLVKSSDVVSILPELTNEGVAIALPKFAFEAEYEQSLKEALRSIGLVAPFDFGYCGIFGNSCATLQFIKQKTFIDVHEKGTEAAAVTIGGLERGIDMTTPSVTSFIADHAFQFFIYVQGEDLVLFEGTVEEPTRSDASLNPAPLDSKHAESDFWSSNFGVYPVGPNATGVAMADPSARNATTTATKLTPAPFGSDVMTIPSLPTAAPTSQAGDDSTMVPTAAPQLPTSEQPSDGPVDQTLVISAPPTSVGVSLQLPSGVLRPAVQRLIVLVAVLGAGLI